MKPEKEKKSKKPKKVDNNKVEEKGEYSNQNLFNRIDKMKSGGVMADSSIDDDMILSSDFMSRKEP